MSPSQPGLGAASNPWRECSSADQFTTDLTGQVDEIRLVRRRRVAPGPVGSSDILGG